MSAPLLDLKLRRLQDTGVATVRNCSCRQMISAARWRGHKWEAYLLRSDHRRVLQALLQLTQSAEDPGAAMSAPNPNAIDIIPRVNRP